MKWVMTERKAIEVDEEIVDTRLGKATRRVVKVFEVGDEAPPGYGGKPFTRRVEEPEPAEVRVDVGGSDRMDRGKGAKKRRKE